MGKKITGDAQPNGSVPWIYTDHGKTWVGVDYPGMGETSYRVHRDESGVIISSKDGGQIYFPLSVIPFLIKALKKK